MGVAKGEMKSDTRPSPCITPKMLSKRKGARKSSPKKNTNGKKSSIRFAPSKSRDTSSRRYAIRNKKEIQKAVQA